MLQLPCQCGCTWSCLGGSGPEELFAHVVPQPTNQPTSQPASQPTNQPTNQPTYLSIYLSTYLQNTEQTSNQTNQSTNQKTKTKKTTNKLQTNKLEGNKQTSKNKRRSAPKINQLVAFFLPTRLPLAGQNRVGCVLLCACASESVCTFVLFQSGLSRHNCVVWWAVKVQ